MTGKWASSNRRGNLPSDWPKRRQQAKKRAEGRCQAKQHEPECDGIGTDCDHIDGRDDHSLANLQWLSRPCHKAKTQREARAAQPQRKRPPEQHPGRLT